MATTKDEAAKTEAPVKEPSAKGAAKAAKELVAPKQMMYVGPNIPGGRLRSGQVFKGGYPPWCADLFEERPEIKELFVPVFEVMRVQKKLKEPGSNEARLYQKAKGVKEAG